jgi:hypothetical protein
MVVATYPKEGLRCHNHVFEDGSYGRNTFENMP